VEEEEGSVARRLQSRII